MSKLLAIVFMLGLNTTAFAGFDEGHAAYIAGNYTQALKEWAPLAEQGDARSQYNLGLLYENGRGVPKDYKQAFAWYRKAADQGYANAQFNLGVMYANGQGVPKNRVTAYAIWNLSNDPSAVNNAAKYRKAIANKMTAKEIDAGQNLLREMSQPMNFLKALDIYIEQSAAKEPHE
jgi:TPR repeat protein